MAVKDSAELEQQQTAAQSAGIFNGGVNYTNSYLGYLQGDIPVMTSDKSKEFISKIRDTIKKEMLSDKRFEDFHLFILDRDVEQRLAYSYIVLSKVEDTKVYYFTVILEATGRKPMSASDVMDEFNMSIKSRTFSNKIWTTDDAFNTVLRELIGDVVCGDAAANYNAVARGNSNFKPRTAKDYVAISADGVIIPYFAENFETLPAYVLTAGFNAISSASFLSNNTKDLNVAVASQATQGATLRVDSSVIKSVNKDELENPIRADWRLELNLRANNESNLSYVEELNRGNSNATLVKACGYVDAVPDEKITPVPGGLPIREVRMRPHIVITDINVSKPTTGFTLLGIITSMIMTNKSMWLGAVLPDKGKYNVGALNLKANLENNPTGLGNFIDLNRSGKDKMSDDEVLTFVNKLFELDPVVSVDVPSYGPHTYYLSVLSAAASGSNSNNTLGAQEALINSAVMLTNNNFPANFPKHEIFANEGVLIPLGVWKDKTGVLRDIRDVDMTMIASETQDVSLMDKWFLSNLPSKYTNLDPYLTKVDLISKVIPKAEITSKAVRVTFTASFVNTLVDAAIKAGFNVRYEPEVKLQEVSNLTGMYGYNASAAIGDVSRFARQNVIVGNNYNTFWVNNGQRF